MVLGTARRLLNNAADVFQVVFLSLARLAKSRQSVADWLYVTTCRIAAWAHDRILRVARTVADLPGSERITQVHVAEAIGFRALDRKLWQG